MRPDPAATALFDQMVDLVACYRPSGEILYINDAGVEMLGVPREQLVGRCAWDLFPAARGNAFHEAFQRVARTGKPELFEHYSEAMERWYRNEIYLASDRIYVIARDVTEHKQATARLQTLAVVSRSFAQAASSSPGAFLEVARTVSEVLGDTCIIRVVSADGERLGGLLGAWDPDAAVRRLFEGLPATSLTEGISGETLRSGRALLVRNIDAASVTQSFSTPELRSIVKKLAVHSLMSAPLRIGGKVGGVMVVARRRSGTRLRYSAADLTLLEELADRASMVIEHWRSFEQMEEAHLRLETISDALPALVALVDENRRYQFVNATYERWFGTRREEILGRTVDEVLGAAAAAAVAPHVDAALGGRAVTFEARVPYTASGERDVQATYTPYVVDGRVAGFIALVNDVTDRRRVDEALRASEAQVRELVENLPELAWSARPDGHIDFYNHRWFEYTGTTSEEMAGWGWQRVHDPQVLPQVMERWQRSLESGEPFEMEFPLRGASGTFRWFLTRVRPLRDAEGRIVRWFGTNTDITAVREAEGLARAAAERLQLLSQASAAFMRAKGDTGALLQILVDEIVPSIADAANVVMLPGNGEAVQVAARKQGSAQLEPPGLERGELGTGDDLAARALETGSAISSGRTLAAPLRTSRITFGVVNALRSESSPPFSAEDQSLLQEIAHRAALKIEAAKRFAEAQEAIRLRDDFLSVASHELRTPLTVLQLELQSLTQLLAKSEASPGAEVARSKFPRKLESATRQVGRLGRLVDDLLDVSRISSGRLTLRPEPLDVRELAREVIERHAAQAEAAGCDVRLMVESSVEGRWDRLRLEQVLTNLLTNAIKYAAGKPVEIQVSARGEVAEVSVRDAGMGIHPQDAARIFDRFERAVSSKNYGGLGLGLYITRQIVEAHGGNISVHSEPGKGSTFTVALPRHPPAATDAEIAGSAT
jgi:PAS domain S-box-containing protein